MTSSAAGFPRMLTAMIMRVLGSEPFELAQVHVEGFEFDVHEP